MSKLEQLESISDVVSKAVLLSPSISFDAFCCFGQTREWEPLSPLGSRVLVMRDQALNTPTPKDTSFPSVTP